MNKESLFYCVACWNSDPYLIETCEQVDEIWNEISENGFHQIESGTEDYEISCAQLDLDSKLGCSVFESDNYSCKFGGLEV